MLEALETLHWWAAQQHELYSAIFDYTIGHLAGQCRRPDCYALYFMEVLSGIALANVGGVSVGQKGH